MDAYKIAIAVGIYLAALWVLAYILCWVGQWVWAWLDDSEVGKGNKIVNYLSKKAGYTDRDCSTFRFYTPSGGISDGALPFVTCGALLSAVPFVAVCAFSFYPITIGAATAIAVAFIARFALRNKKLFDKHVKNKDAHK